VEGERVGATSQLDQSGIQARRVGEDTAADRELGRVAIRPRVVDGAVAIDMQRYIAADAQDPVLAEVECRARQAVIGAANAEVYASARDMQVSSLEDEVAVGNVDT